MASSVANYAHMAYTIEIYVQTDISQAFVTITNGKYKIS